MLTIVIIPREDPLLRLQKRDNVQLHYSSLKLCKIPKYEGSIEYMLLYIHGVEDNY